MGLWTIFAPTHKWELKACTWDVVSKTWRHIIIYHMRLTSQDLFLSLQLLNDVLFSLFSLHKWSLQPHTLFQYLFLGSPTPKPMQSHIQKYARKNHIKGNTHKLVHMDFNKCKIKTKQFNTTLIGNSHTSYATLERQQMLCFHH